MVEILVNGRPDLYQQFVNMGAKDKALNQKKWLCKYCGFDAGDIVIKCHEWAVVDLSDGTEIFFQTLADASRGMLFIAKEYGRDNFEIQQRWN